MTVSKNDVDVSYSLKSDPAIEVFVNASLISEISSKRFEKNSLAGHPHGRSTMELKTPAFT